MKMFTERMRVRTGDGGLLEVSPADVVAVVREEGGPLAGGTEAGEGPVTLLLQGGHTVRVHVDAGQLSKAIDAMHVRARAMLVSLLSTAAHTEPGILEAVLPAPATDTGGKPN